MEIEIQQQEDSGDFYGQYFCKDYDVRDARFLKFFVDNIGHERLLAASSLLDIGTGSGKFSILLNRVYPNLQVEALDVSANNGNTIRGNTLEAGSEITATEDSALDLPYYDGSFEIVLCVYLLQHTPNPHFKFLEAARVLSPGGCVLYSIGGANGLCIVHQKTRCLFGTVPPSLRRSTVLPLVSHWSLLKATNRQKTSDSDLTIDLVNWLYSPLKKFVPEEKITAWFEEAGLIYTSLNWTGLRRSVHVCRVVKLEAQL